MDPHSKETVELAMSDLNKVVDLGKKETGRKGGKKKDKSTESLPVTTSISKMEVTPLKSEVPMSKVDDVIQDNLKSVNEFQKGVKTTMETSTRLEDLPSKTSPVVEKGIKVSPSSVVEEKRVVENVQRKSNELFIAREKETLEGQQPNTQKIKNPEQEKSEGKNKKKDGKSPQSVSKDVVQDALIISQEVKPKPKEEQIATETVKAKGNSKGFKQKTLVNNEKDKTPSSQDKSLNNKTDNLNQNKNVDSIKDEPVSVDKQKPLSLETKKDNESSGNQNKENKSNELVKEINETLSISDPHKKQDKEHPKCQKIKVTEPVKGKNKDSFEVINADEPIKKDKDFTVSGLTTNKSVNNSKENTQLKELEKDKIEKVVAKDKNSEKQKVGKDVNEKRENDIDNKKKLNDEEKVSQVSQNSKIDKKKVKPQENIADKNGKGKPSIVEKEMQINKHSGKQKLKDDDAIKQELKKDVITDETEKISVSSTLIKPDKDTAQKPVGKNVTKTDLKLESKPEKGSEDGKIQNLSTVIVSEQVIETSNSKRKNKKNKEKNSAPEKSVGTESSPKPKEETKSAGQPETVQIKSKPALDGNERQKVIKETSETKKEKKNKKPNENEEKSVSPKSSTGVVISTPNIHVSEPKNSEKEQCADALGNHQEHKKKRNRRKKNKHSEQNLVVPLVERENEKPEVEVKKEHENVENGKKSQKHTNVKPQALIAESVKIYAEKEVPEQRSSRTKTKNTQPSATNSFLTVGYGTDRSRSRSRSRSSDVVKVSVRGDIIPLEEIEKIEKKVEEKKAKAIAMEKQRAEEEAKKLLAKTIKTTENIIKVTVSDETDSNAVKAGHPKEIKKVELELKNFEKPTGTICESAITKEKPRDVKKTDNLPINTNAKQSLKILERDSNETMKPAVETATKKEGNKSTEKTAAVRKPTEGDNAKSDARKNVTESDPLNQSKLENPADMGKDDKKIVEIEEKKSKVDKCIENTKETIKNKSQSEKNFNEKTSKLKNQGAAETEKSTKGDATDKIKDKLPEIVEKGKGHSTSSDPKKVKSEAEVQRPWGDVTNFIANEQKNLSPVPGKITYLKDNKKLEKDKKDFKDKPESKEIKPGEEVNVHEKVSENNSISLDKTKQEAETKKIEGIKISNKNITKETEVVESVEMKNKKDEKQAFPENKEDKLKEESEKKKKNLKQVLEKDDKKEILRGNKKQPERLQGSEVVVPSTVQTNLKSVDENKILSSAPSEKLESKTDNKMPNQENSSSEIQSANISEVKIKSNDKVIIPQKPLITSEYSESSSDENPSIKVKKHGKSTKVKRITAHFADEPEKMKNLSQTFIDKERTIPTVVKTFAYHDIQEPITERDGKTVSLMKTAETDKKLTDKIEVISIISEKSEKKLKPEKTSDETVLNVTEFKVSVKQEDKTAANVTEKEVTEVKSENTANRKIEDNKLGETIKILETNITTNLTDQTTRPTTEGSEEISSKVKIDQLKIKEIEGVVDNKKKEKLEKIKDEMSFRKTVVEPTPIKQDPKVSKKDFSGKPDKLIDSSKKEKNVQLPEKLHDQKGFKEIGEVEKSTEGIVEKDQTKKQQKAGCKSPESSVPETIQKNLKEPEIEILGKTKGLDEPFKTISKGNIIKDEKEEEKIDKEFKENELLKQTKADEKEEFGIIPEKPKEFSCLTIESEKKIGFQNNSKESEKIAKETCDLEKTKKEEKKTGDGPKSQSIPKNKDNQRKDLPEKPKEQVKHFSEDDSAKRSDSKLKVGSFQTEENQKKPTDKLQNKAKDSEVSGESVLKPDIVKIKGEVSTIEKPKDECKTSEKKSLKNSKEKKPTPDKEIIKLLKDHAPEKKEKYEKEDISKTVAKTKPTTFYEEIKVPPQVTWTQPVTKVASDPKVKEHTSKDQVKPKTLEKQNTEVKEEKKSEKPFDLKVDDSSNSWMDVLDNETIIADDEWRNEPEKVLKRRDTKKNVSLNYPQPVDQPISSKEEPVQRRLSVSEMIKNIECDKCEEGKVGDDVIFGSVKERHRGPRKIIDIRPKEKDAIRQCSSDTLSKLDDTMAEPKTDSSLTYTIHDSCPRMWPEYVLYKDCERVWQENKAIEKKKEGGEEKAVKPPLEKIEKNLSTTTVITPVKTTPIITIGVEDVTSQSAVEPTHSKEVAVNVKKSEKEKRDTILLSAPDRRKSRSRSRSRSKSRNKNSKTSETSLHILQVDTGRERSRSRSRSRGDVVKVSVRGDIVPMEELKKLEEKEAEKAERKEKLKEAQSKKVEKTKEAVKAKEQVIVTKVSEKSVEIFENKGSKEKNPGLKDKPEKLKKIEPVVIEPATKTDTKVITETSSKDKIIAGKDLTHSGTLFPPGKDKAKQQETKFENPSNEAIKDEPLEKKEKTPVPSETKIKTALLKPDHPSSDKATGKDESKTKPFQQEEVVQQRKASVQLSKVRVPEDCGRQIHENQPSATHLSIDLNDDKNFWPDKWQYEDAENALRLIAREVKVETKPEKPKKRDEDEDKDGNRDRQNDFLSRKPLPREPKLDEEGSDGKTCSYPLPGGVGAWTAENTYLSKAPDFVSSPATDPRQPENVEKSNYPGRVPSSKSFNYRESFEDEEEKKRQRKPGETTLITIAKVGAAACVIGVSLWMAFGKWRTTL